MESLNIERAEHFQLSLKFWTRYTVSEKFSLKKPQTKIEKIVWAHYRVCHQAISQLLIPSSFVGDVLLRWPETVFQGKYLPSLSINNVAINKDLEIKIATTVVLDNDENLLWYFYIYRTFLLYKWKEPLVIPGIVSKFHFHVNNSN